VSAHSSCSKIVRARKLFVLENFAQEFRTAPSYFSIQIFIQTDAYDRPQAL
jgi:hypothetical protein